MTPNRDYIRRLLKERDWSGAELAKRMGISRAEVCRFLNEKRIGGKKFLEGLLRAFPEESVETLFILPIVSPIVNINESDVPLKFQYEAPAREPPSSQKKVMKPVRHPNNGHKIVCSFDEGCGIVEIVEGKNITTLHVPTGPIEVRHTTKQAVDTS